MHPQEWFHQLIVGALEIDGMYKDMPKALKVGVEEHLKNNTSSLSVEKQLSEFIISKINNTFE